MTRTEVVLSGGGAKAAAHAGAAEALASAGVEAHRYVATSMGAVIAAMLAGGMPPAEVSRRVRAVDAGRVARPRGAALVGGMFAGSVLAHGPLRALIASLVPARRFAELRVPLAVTTTDLDSGDRVLLGDGGEDAPLVEALLAACALPIYYAPVRLNGLRLADGGLRGALPLWAVSAGAERVVAVDVGPRFDETPGRPPQGPPLVRLADAALGVAMAGLSDADIAEWRADATRPPLVLVRPPVPRHATFATEVVDECIEAGRMAMAAALAEAPVRGGMA